MANFYESSNNYNLVDFSSSNDFFCHMEFVVWLMINLKCTFTDFGQDGVFEGVHHRKQRHGPNKAVLNWIIFHLKAFKLKGIDKEPEKREVGHPLYLQYSLFHNSILIGIIPPNSS